MAAAVEEKGFRPGLVSVVQTFSDPAAKEAAAAKEAG